MPKTEFQRENRYVVFKCSDMRKYLSQSERRQVEGLALHICLSREGDSKHPLNCLVVESDWPEYEPTWKLIEARVMGAQPAQGEEARLVSYHPDGDTCTLNINGVEMYYDRVDRNTQHAPSMADVDYLVDTLSKFADHHVEHGRMSFDKWTLRSAVEAMLAAAALKPEGE